MYTQAGTPRMHKLVGLHPELAREGEGGCCPDACQCWLPHS